MRNKIVRLIILSSMTLFACKFFSDTFKPENGIETEAISTPILNVSSEGNETYSKLELNPKIKGSDYIFFSWNPDHFSLGEVDNIYSGNVEDNQIYCLTCDIDNNQISANALYYLPPMISDNRRLMVISTADDDSEQYASWIVNLGNGIMKQSPFLMVNPFWHHDNKLLSFLNPDERLTAYDIYNQEISLEFPEEIGFSNRDFAWSSNDKSVVFSMDYEKLAIIDTEINNIHFLSHESDGFFYAYPAWSPKEKILAYVSDKAGRSTGVTGKDLYGDLAGSGRDEFFNAIDLYISDIEKNSEICLTCTPNFQFHYIKYPTWNNSGDKIVFFAHDISKYPDDVTEGLYVINLDGSEMRLLAEYTDIKYGLSTYYRHGGPPNWSRDEKFLLFSAPHGDNYAVFKVDVKRSNIDLLASDSNQDYVYPKWLTR